MQAIRSKPRVAALACIDSIVKQTLASQRSLADVGSTLDCVSYQKDRSMPGRDASYSTPIVTYLSGRASKLVAWVTEV